MINYSSKTGILPVYTDGEIVVAITRRSGTNERTNERAHGYEEEKVFR